MTKFKEYGFETTTMTPPTSLEDIASISNSDLEVLVGIAPSASYSAENEIAMLRDRLEKAEASEKQLRMLNQFFADAGRATSIEELEMGYEHAIASIFGIKDAAVRIFTSPEAADRHELSRDPSQVFTKDIYGQTHSDLYHMVSIECRSRGSAKKMNCIQNPNFGVFLENVMANTQNKLKGWIDRKSGLFT
ncbi:hypothetical protein JW707_01100, partial [Candidatus Woesearchaeota archaeon]|nr:hypothetical protein [Candidatus Woesearchaeota archaeon]